MTKYYGFNAEIMLFSILKMRLGVFKRPWRFLRKNCLYHSVFDTRLLNVSNVPANFISISFCRFKFIAKTISVALEVSLSISA